MSTAGGFLAIIFWSMSIPLSRSLTEKLGMFNTAGLACLFGGMLAILYYVVAYRSRFKTLTKSSSRYLLFCGVPIVFYTIFLYAAIGLAATRQHIVEDGLVNYLVPTCNLIF